MDLLYFCIEVYVYAVNTRQIRKKDYKGCLPRYEKYVY